MRTSIVIDDALMAAAMKAGGFRTKRATVEAGLRLLVRMRAQRGLRALRGRIHWHGNLDEMRRDWQPGGKADCLVASLLLRNKAANRV